MKTRSPDGKSTKPGSTGKSADGEIPREISDVEKLARRLANVAPEEDPARVAGAIAIFAARTIERSAENLQEARAYLDGLKDAIDGLLRYHFDRDKQDQRIDNDGHPSEKTPP